MNVSFEIVRRKLLCSRQGNRYSNNTNKQNSRWCFISQRSVEFLFLSVGEIMLVWFNQFTNNTLQLHSLFSICVIHLFFFFEVSMLRSTTSNAKRKYFFYTLLQNKSIQRYLENLKIRGSFTDSRCFYEIKFAFFQYWFI